MRNRHIPRVCRNCRAPMARQEDTCWRCGVEWASEEGPRTTLRLVSDGAPSQAEGTPDRPTAVAVAALARTANEARRDAERWTNEGGSFAAEVAAPIGAAPRR
jgi:hypothetical protein